jgi:hypothetical protein
MLIMIVLILISYYLLFMFIWRDQVVGYILYILAYIAIKHPIIITMINITMIIMIIMITIILLVVIELPGYLMLK